MVRLMPDYSELYLQVKNHIADKTLPVCAIQHCIEDNELESPMLSMVVVVARVQVQKNLAMIDLLQPAHFAYFQKAEVNQVGCYEGLLLELYSLWLVV